MKLSPVIRTQEDFEKYMESNSTYFELMSELVNVYKKLNYHWEEIFSPIPSDAWLVCILKLEEDIIFNGYKIKFIY